MFQFVCRRRVVVRRPVFHALVTGLALMLVAPRAAVAQFFPVQPTVPGVWIEQDGNVKSRQVDATQELNAIRARAKAAAAAAKDEKLAYVSLPRLFERARAAIDAGKPIPDELRYLGGLTQVRYVLVYPQEKDLVIAGPAEPFTLKGDGMYAFGKRSGRPVLQLDDLVVALRTANSRDGRVFGCRIDPNPKSMELSKEVMNKFARAPRKERMDAMAKALGPQQVSVFGTQADTRLAFVCVAADYKLKRFALGLEPAANAPGVNVGNAVDNTRAAMNRFWFETGYEPLRVSADGNAYEIRGQRLQIKAGKFDFDPRGATEKAMEFARKMNARVPALAVAEPLVAELQNVADLSLLANLVRIDRLDRKAGWDAAWLLDESKFPVKKVPVPVTADTLVSATGGSLAAGGVRFAPAETVGRGPRENDDGGALETPRRQAGELRQQNKDAEKAVLPAP